MRLWTNEIAEEASRCQGLFPLSISEKALRKKLISPFQKDYGKPCSKLINKSITFKNKEINMKSAYFPAKTLSAALTNITQTELRSRTVIIPCSHINLNPSPNPNPNPNQRFICHVLTLMD